MNAYQIAQNEKNSMYEVHVAGCKHLIASHMEICYGMYEAATGAEVVAEFNANNEGCIAKSGPCAK